MGKLLNLAKPSPFKAGCLAVLAAALLYYSFGTGKPALLSAIDNRLVDAMFHWRGPRPATQSVVIVDIDEKSLRALGQWPWPRDQVAELVKAIAAARPRVIGFDIVFAEADRTSPRRFLDRLRPLLHNAIPPKALAELKNNNALDNDLILGEALAGYPTVLGYVFQTMDDGLKDAEETPFPSSTFRLVPTTTAYRDLALRSAYRAIVNTPDIAQAESEGFINVFPDSAGTIRSVPLVMEMDGVPYPSLALEMLRIGLGGQEIVIHASQQVTAAKRGMLGVEVAGRFLPTSDQGEMMINFRGPARSFPYFSAVDIMNGEDQHSLTDKYVLIGTSAAGLLDLRATPYANVFPGVEVQATIIDNALAGDPFTYDVYTEIGLTITLVVAGGILLSGLLAYSSPLAGGLGGILILEATMAGNYYFFFLRQRILGVTYPLLTALTVFMTVTLFNYFFEGREKRFISRAFGHYVSPAVVSELRKDPGKLSLAGEQKNLTVLFSDIRNFTTISEGMDSGALGTFMNEYLTAMSNVVMEYKGTVDKFIGDAVMAIWGAPLTDHDHAANCVGAAFKMLARLEELRPEWEARGLPLIDIGIGVNTGMMNVGNFGSTQRFDYTVMGDNVNLASRLEGANKTYGSNIIISEYTRAALGDRFFCRLLDLVRVKGKSRPVKIYEPLVDGPPGPGLKKEVELFEQAFSLYQARQFDLARELIAGLHAVRPAKLYDLYLGRIEVYQQTPPPAEWDGAFTFTSK